MQAAGVLEVESSTVEPKARPESRVGTAIVTGASSGIGEATARALAANGHRVALGARREARLKTLVAEIEASGGRALAHPLDLADGASVDAFFAAVERDLGPADILVNNAAICLPGLFGQTSAEDLELEVATNLLGPMRLTRHVLRSLQSRDAKGDLVFISSENAVVARTYQAGYTATKRAIEGMVAVLRMELEGTGIRSTVVRPGPTQSEFGHAWSPDLLRKILDSWKYWGVQRHFGYLPATSVASAVLSVVSAPPGTHLTLVEVMPEGPRKA